MNGCASLCLSLWLGLVGCHHKKVAPVVLPQQTPVALEPVESPDKADLIETSKPTLPPVPVAEAASNPKLKKKRTKPATPAAAPAPVPVVEPPTPVAGTEASPEATAIGELTAGGEQSPQTQQAAADLIATNERRLGSLPEDKLRSQRSLVSKVRNFQRQAQQAMHSGDVEGAKTLATKAKLLLDDLDKDASRE